MKEIPPCIRCGNSFENVGAHREEDINQPYAGLKFGANGHYGSAAFDPLDGTVWLEINICDPCLWELADEGRVLLGREHPAGHVNRITYEPWKPDDPDMGH